MIKSNSANLNLKAKMDIEREGFLGINLIEKTSAENISSI